MKNRLVRLLGHDTLHGGRPERIADVLFSTVSFTLWLGLVLLLCWGRLA